MNSDRREAGVVGGDEQHQPRFHDGSAALLIDVIDFYDLQFKIHLTEPQQRLDLEAFLKSL